MARYQYIATWTEGDDKAIEASEADDTFCLGPDYLAASLHASIAARSKSAKNIDVTIGAMVPGPSRPVSL